MTIQALPHLKDLLVSLRERRYQLEKCLDFHKGNINAAMDELLKPTKESIARISEMIAQIGKEIDHIENSNS